jgi:cellulose biosynthesis protein BcsQ
MPGVIISIANNKGGTGKTTTACNLGHALASRYNKRVLVVDNDPQCNTTDILLGGAETIFTLYGVAAAVVRNPTLSIPRNVCLRNILKTQDRPF